MHKVIPNSQFLEMPSNADGTPYLLPHEQQAVDAAQQKNEAAFEQIVRNKQLVTGGDDWHDGAFRTTDNEAKIIAESNARIAPYVGATVVSYPEETEERVTLGSRVFVSQNNITFPVDIVGFRQGYPMDVVDKETGEDVTGVTPDSPLGQGIIGKKAGEKAEYQQLERVMTVTIERINQTAVREYFMESAGVELEENRSLEQEAEA